MIRVQRIDTLQFEGRILFNFRVEFGASGHNWVVSRTYEDFASLHADLQEQYGKSAPPILPRLEVRNAAHDAVTKKRSSGRLGLFRRRGPSHQPEADPTDDMNNIDDEVLDCTHRRLEDYLQETIASSNSWESVHTIGVPNPGGKGKPNVRVLSSLFEFFEFEQYLLIPGCDVDDSGALGSESTPPTSARVTSQPSDVDPPAESATASPTASPQRQSRFAAKLIPQDGSADPSRSSRHLNNDQLALAAVASDITTQILVKVKNFSIYKDDRIDYHIHVTLCGHQWVVSKRYSELEELHELLKSFYGKTSVPSFRESRVAAWKKLDQKTGLLRQRFFDDYLLEVIMSIDQWNPQGLLTSFELERSTLDGLRSRVTVSVNQFLFEFFNFEAHVSMLSGEEALQVLEEQQSVLPEEAKVAFAKKSRSDRRAAMDSAIEKQAKRLRLTSETELQALEYAFSLLRDDRDIIRLFEHFLITSEVATDITKVANDGSRVMTVHRMDNTTTSHQAHHGAGDGGSGETGLLSPGSTPRPPLSNGGTLTTVSFNLISPVKRTPVVSQKFQLDKEACTYRMGVTSGQLLRLVEPISFNDTRIAVIRLFTPALVDISELQLVFDLLWYDWDSARLEVEELLLAE